MLHHLGKPMLLYRTVLYSVKQNLNTETRRQTYRSTQYRHFNSLYKVSRNITVGNAKKLNRSKAIKFYENVEKHTAISVGTIINSSQPRPELKYVVNAKRNDAISSQEVRINLRVTSGQGNDEISGYLLLQCVFERLNKIWRFILADYHQFRRFLKMTNCLCAFLKYFMKLFLISRL